MADKYQSFAPTPNSFGRRARLVTPSDEADLPNVAKALVTASQGSLAVIPRDNPDDEPVEFDEVPAGFIVPFMVRRVMATGTDAVVYTIED